MRGVLLEPAVVGIEAGLLVVLIRMIAEHHAHSRIDDFGAHTVAVLVSQPGCRIPAAAMEILEERTAGAEAAGLDAGRSNQAHRDGLLHAFHDIDVAELGIALDMRRAFAPSGLYMITIAIGWLGDVRICGYCSECHGPLLMQLIVDRRAL